MLTELEIRRKLYDDSGIVPLFNPIKSLSHGSPLVIDLTADIFNATRVTHTKLDKVLDLAKEAKVIVAETESLAHLVRKVIPKANVVAVAYGGIVDAVDIENDNIVFGILNHDDNTNMNNSSIHSAAIFEVIKEFGEVLVYGEEMHIGKATEDFSEFAARVDVLILPALKDSINSVALPLALMSAGTVILAVNNGSYYTLNAATGVRMLPRDDPDAWKVAVTNVLASRAKLDQLKEFNRRFVIDMNGKAQKAIRFLEDRIGPTEKPAKKKKEEEIVIQEEVLLDSDEEVAPNIDE